VTSRLVAALGLAYLASLLFKRAAALRYLDRERRRRVAAGPRPSASIVQAILSGDPALEATLERSLDAIEGAPFLWLVDEDDAEAMRVCESLAARHREREVVVLRTPPAPDDVNPKLFKLRLAQERIATESLIVLDDDTELTGPAYAALLDALGWAELSTSLPSYAPGRGLPSALVEHFVNDNAALTYLCVCALTEPVSISGMCYALRLETLRAIGGFGAIAHVLADDLAIARAVRAHGGRLHQTIVPHRTSTTVDGVRRYVALMHRWFLFATLLLESERPAIKALLVVLYVLPPLVLLATVVLALAAADAPAAGVLFVVLFARSATIADVQRRTPVEARRRWSVSLLAELLQPFHALHGALVRTIRWRSKRYRVRANDDFVRIA
jgi:ceramide glucosyltransferase